METLIIVGTVVSVTCIILVMAFIHFERSFRKLEKLVIEKETERRKWDIRYHWNKD